MALNQQQITIEPLLIDSRYAAKILSISRSSLYSLLSAGRIGPPIIKITGGRSLFSLADLKSWVSMRDPLKGTLPNREQWIKINGVAAAKRKL
jgi:predicted DNA-binding transcriptional regulator AlpA